MGYDLRAVIGGADLMRGVVRDIGAGDVVRLEQGLALTPVTDAFSDAVTDGGTARELGFFFLPGGFGARLSGWSAKGPLAYVEADFFGGAGEQRAAVWEGGALVLGPVHLGEAELFAASGSPISQALRQLGAVAGRSYDEFAAVGLGRCRRTGDWAGSGPGDGVRPG